MTGVQTCALPIFLPESINYYDHPENLKKGFGVCTDKPIFYRNYINKNSGEFNE